MTISSEIGMVCYWFDAISWVVNQQLKQLSHFCGPLIYCYTPILEPSDAPLVLVATRYAIKLHRSFRFSDISLWRSETACESMWFCMKYRSYHRFGLMAYDGLPRIPFNSRCNYVHLSRPFIYHWFMYIYMYVKSHRRVSNRTAISHLDVSSEAPNELGPVVFDRSKMLATPSRSLAGKLAREQSCPKPPPMFKMSKVSALKRTWEDLATCQVGPKKQTKPIDCWEHYEYDRICIS